MKRSFMMVLVGVLFFSLVNLSVADQKIDRNTVNKIVDAMQTIDLNSSAITQKLLDSGIEKDALEVTIGNFLWEIQNFSKREKVKIPKINLVEEYYDVYDGIILNMTIIESARRVLVEFQEIFKSERGSNAERKDLKDSIIQIRKFLQNAREKYLKEQFQIDYANIVLLNCQQIDSNNIDSFDSKFFDIIFGKERK